jgi:hypothetical protein
MDATFEHKSISGIGDYLNALNHALYLCDLLRLSYLHTPSQLPIRTGHPSIDAFLGINHLPAISERTEDWEELTMYQGYSSIAEGNSWVSGFAGHQRIKIVFAPSDYQHGSFFSEVRRNNKMFGYHKSLTTALVNSQMYSRYRHLKTGLNSSSAKRLLLHVRRGDVALTPLRLIAQEYSIKDFTDAYYYPITGEIIHGLPSDFSNLHQSHRIISNDAYLKALDETIASSNPLDVILVSDGYTQASKHIAKIVMQKKGLSNVHPGDVELLLNQNLAPLTEKATLSLIGETSCNLELSLVEFLLADHVIHGPSCFPMSIRRMTGVEDPALKALAQS